MNTTTLHDRIDDLARHDGRMSIFGANAHGWRRMPVPLAEVEAFEARHDVKLPDAYRAWITEVGLGAGPFYGLEPLATDPEDRRPGRPFPHENRYDGGPLPPGVDAADGTVVLANQGCGYYDLLVVRGPRKGEVWIDLRGAEGPILPWFPDFGAWLEAWLRRSEAEWAVDYLADGKPVEAESAFLARCRSAVQALIAGPLDPMCEQYPLPRDRLLQAEARLALAAGEFEAAEAAFDEAAKYSSEPAGALAVGRCAVAEARGDHEARRAAAAAGLAQEGLWWSTRAQLLRAHFTALENLERWDEAFAVRVAYAEHCSNDLHAWYDVAWIHLVREEAAEAAAWLRRAADQGVGCDLEAPLEARLAELVAGLLPALEGAGHTAEAAALVAALGLPG